jgi:hypothetical protein
MTNSISQLGLLTSTAGLCLVALACGGTENTPRPERVAADSVAPLDRTDCDAATDAFEFEVLEPFGFGAVNDSDSRILGWYVSVDGTNPDHTPNVLWAQFNPVRGGAPSLTGDEQCEVSSYAMQLVSSGDGFRDWGMSFGSNMHDTSGTNADGRNHTDATDWDGIAFWARRSEDTSPNQALKMTVVDEFTAADKGSYCRDGLYDAEGCDAYGRAVLLSDEWELFLIRFEEMYQEGHGLRSEEPTVLLEEVGGVSFLVGGGTWEVWVDEVAYFRTKD